MATQIKFTSTKLTNSKKQGLLVPDSDGCFELVIGGLNTYNSVGEYYTADGAKQLFQQSSSFMRRMSNGCLKGESGHPKRLPGMSPDDYIRRILSIEETNVCCFFKEIWLDEQFGRQNPQYNNPSLVAIKAKVKPAGPRGESLRASLEDKDQNVCFSIRAFTKDYYQRGQTIRVLDQIVTWDNVIEPGISIANKWDSPALEGLEDMIVSKKSIEHIVHDIPESLAMEESSVIAKDLLRSFTVLPSIPLYGKW